MNSEILREEILNTIYKHYKTYADYNGNMELNIPLVDFNMQLLDILKGISLLEKEGYLKIPLSHKLRQSADTPNTIKIITTDKLTYYFDTEKTLEQEEENDIIIYKVKLENNRQISINNKNLSKPRFNSENDLVFEYIYNNPNRKITKKEAENALKIDFVKKFDRIIRDLKFTGELKNMFFPNVSIDAIEFINPITIHYFKKNKLIPLKFVDKL